MNDKHRLYRAATLEGPGGRRGDKRHLVNSRNLSSLCGLSRGRMSMRFGNGMWHWVDWDEGPAHPGGIGCKRCRAMMAPRLKEADIAPHWKRLFGIEGRVKWS